MDWAVKKSNATLVTLATAYKSLELLHRQSREMALKKTTTAILIVAETSVASVS
jgi:hypothetical protein